LVISLLGSVTAEENQRLGIDVCLPLFPDTPDCCVQLDVSPTRIQVGVAGGLALIWSSLGVFGTRAVNRRGRQKQRSFSNTGWFPS
jgi:hypothetical protein